MPRVIALAVGLGSAAGLGCRGDDPAAAGTACALRESEAAHACIHGASGPFVAAVAGALADGSAPTFDRTHVVYDVELLPLPGAQHGGDVAFRASRSGAYGIFLRPAAAVELRRTDGRSLASALATPATHCPAFGFVHVVQLEAGSLTTLSVAPTPSPRVSLLLERLGPQVASVVTDVCPERGDAPGAAEGPRGDPDGGDVMALPGDAGAGDGGRLCRTTGPCTRDDECCGHCHDYDHCH